VGAATALLGHLAGARPITLAGAAAVVACAGILAPELTLALLIVIAGIKDASFLAFLPVDATVLVAAGVLAAMAARAWSRGVRPFPPAAVFGLLLAMLVMAAVLWSPDPVGGLDEALRFETLTLMAFFAPFVLIRDADDVSRLMVGLAAFSVVVVLLAVPTGDPNQPLSVVGTSSGGEIELASDCAVGLFAAVYLVMRHRGPARLLAIAAGLLLAKTMVAAGSRGIIAGLLLALAYLAVVTWRSWVRGRRFWLVLASVAALAVAIPQVAGVGLARYRSQLFTENTSAVLGQRTYIFDTARDLAVNHPLGLGAGGFQHVTGLAYPHNIELHLAVNFGLPTLSLFLLLVGAAWSARRRALRYGWRAESIGVGMLMIILVADSQVSNGLNNSPSRCMWLAFGLALVLPRLAAAAPRAQPAPAAETRYHEASATGVPRGALRGAGSPA
jgi:hypothetical protein